MRSFLKPLDQQVMVITGASSGIGLATARRAASRGAALVLAARSAAALDRLVAEIRGQGGQAIAVACDVADPASAAAIADAAEQAFGRIDTWVNNAGLGLYGRLEQVPVDQQRRLFEVNYWGVVYGSLEAVKRLRLGGGGAIINLGSVASQQSIPLQGAYAATKHAIKGFTEALRIELRQERSPISVTLVKPAQIDTPFTVNAPSHLDGEPHHVPKVYAAEAVAGAILAAATRPIPGITVGGGVLMAAAGTLAPGLTDRLVGRFVIPNTDSGRPHRRGPRRSGLDTPTESLSSSGNYEGRVARRSIYTTVALRPGWSAGLLAGLGWVLFSLLRGDGSHKPFELAGRRGGRGEKALHVRLQARRGREDAVRALLQEIEADVREEPGTSAWFAFRLNKRVFGIFERFPDEAARKAHLAGAGAARLAARSNALLRRPARISRVDVIATRT